MLRSSLQQQAVPAVNLPQPGPHGHHRPAVFTPKGDHYGVDGIPITPGRTNSSVGSAYAATGSHMQPGMREEHAASGIQNASPGRMAQSGSGPLLASGPGAYPSTPSRCRSGPPQERLPSPEQAGRMPARSNGMERGASPEASQAVSASTLQRSGSEHSSSLRRGGTNTHSAALLAPVAVAIAASTPVLRGRPGHIPLGAAHNEPGAKTAMAGACSPGIVSGPSLLAGSSLGHLISKVTASVEERDKEMRKQQTEKRELEDLLSRSKEELQQLVSVVSQLHELQQSANEVLPDMLNIGPERPRLRAKPPFFWQPSQEYAEEFDVGGEGGEVVTKTKDFEDQGWVIPVGGSWRLNRGGLYRWTVRVERKCPSRPQLQLGLHGINHSQPWRLVTTSRCSWSRDDEPWQDRPGGDRLIDEGDYVHIEVDLRGANTKCGTMALAINDEPMEQFFDDIPLGTHYPLIPVVSMGGDQSRVRLCPNY